jgi:regulator of protease activity HflC (stomatin/prohibitin superfamily)
MGDLFRAIIDSIHYLWPFRTVSQWERGGYYICGHWWKEVGPGLKVVCPFFTEVITAGVVPALVSTGREDITLADGKTLSFSAMATLRVTDVKTALNEIDNYHESTRELIGSFLAEKLSEVDTVRLTPEKRGAYVSLLQRQLAKEAAEFGIEITKLRFTSFVLSVKTIRLLLDTDHIAGW